MLIKRLAEIEERILEADIWEDPVFTRYLEQRFQNTVQAYNTSVSDVYKSVYQYFNPGKEGMDGTTLVYHNFMDIANIRIKYIKERTRMPDELLNMVFSGNTRYQKFLKIVL